MAVPKKRKYKSWKKHKLNIKFAILKNFKVSKNKNKIVYSSNLLKLFIS